jgi:anti-anti-sigma regulatory factor
MPMDPRRDTVFFLCSTLPDPAGTLLLVANDDLDSVAAGAASAQMSAVLAGGPPAVVLDLAGVFLDAAGIRVLLEITRAATAAAVPLRIIGWPEWLRRLARELVVEELALCPDLPTALAGLRAEPGRAPARSRRGDLSAPGAA